MTILARARVLSGAGGTPDIVLDITIAEWPPTAVEARSVLDVVKLLPLSVRGVATWAEAEGTQVRFHVNNPRKRRRFTLVFQRLSPAPPRG